MRRTQKRVSADFYVNKVVDGVPYLARTRDLSLSGVYLRRLIEPRLPYDAAVALEFVLPGTQEIVWADVDVIRSDNRDGYGLEFRSLTPKVRRLLARYLGQWSEAREESCVHAV